MIEPPQFDEGTIDFIIRGANGEGGVDVKQKAAILGCSGYHIRSIVQSAESYLSTGVSTVQGIFNQTVDRMRTNISTTDYHFICSYIVEACRSGTVPGVDNVAVELLVDGTGALPPAIVWLVCGKPAGDIFKNTFHTDAPKQLEVTAMQYDLFRAQYKLPVIPTSMSVLAKEEDTTWFNNLRFCDAYEQKSESLLKTETGGKLVSTGLLLCRGAYYYPSNSSHPAVDRAFIAVHKDDTTKECLVLVQDKINAEGFPKAVKDLNAAANLLKTFDRPVLCIANVIGAGNLTKSQAIFKHPYVLVRDIEVDSFYSVNFAPAIRFLRSRHVDS
jgi:hypothetical protein